MRTDGTWQEFAAQLLAEYGDGSPSQLARRLGHGISHTTVRRWASEGIMPTGQRSFDAVKELTGLDYADLYEIIRRTRAAATTSATIDSLPAAVREIIDVTLRLTSRQQAEVLQFAQFRAEKAQ